jgi:hypothetical protein
MDLKRKRDNRAEWVLRWDCEWELGRVVGRKWGTVVSFTAI